MIHSGKLIRQIIFGEKHKKKFYAERGNSLKNAKKIFTNKQGKLDIFKIRNVSWPTKYEMSLEINQAVKLQALGKVQK